jgi:hypothetical protein
MSVARSLVAMLAVALCAVVLQGTQFSSATYTGTSGYAAEVTAANDWTPPVVAISQPTDGAIVSGATAVTASATDARSAIASVVIQVAPVDTDTWQTICTATTAPYTCSWTTGTVADGRYQLRATATDTVGLTTTSATVGVRVANNAGVVLGTLPDSFRGALAMTASVTGTGQVAATSISFQYRVSTTTSWTTIAGCTAANTLQASCAWTPTGTSEVYDVRAVAVVGVSTLTDPRDAVQYDPVAPTATLAVPAGVLSGTVALTATAGDDDSGVARVLFEYRRAGTTTWTACGTDTEAPYACALNTTGLVDGATYEFRATATDHAGNVVTTATQTRTVDNTAATVSVTSPASGSTLRGAVTVTADAFSAQGITSVRPEYRAAGGAWVALCTDTTAPYSCAWDTTALPAGSYELRAVLTHGGGTATSAVVPVTLDNSVLRAQDVSATNVGTSGYVNAGDRLVLTYSTVVDLTSIKAGWTGASTSAALALEDTSLAGGTGDRLRFTDANLGHVSFVQNYVKANRSVAFAATMTATTATVAGVDVTVVTVTLGAPQATNNLRTSAATGAMRWTPSGLARTPQGAACAVVPASESGATDRDL